MSELWDIRQPIWMLADDTVRIRYQKTTSEDIEDFMRAGVTVGKPMRQLWLLAVASCLHKW
jgi:hypothetical protein